MKAKEMKALFCLLMLLTGCSFKDMEKEIWIIPCDYMGTLTVYFDGKAVLQTDNNRVYRFNSQGIFYSSLNMNAGFSPDFNQTILMKMVCNNIQKRIFYYSGSDTSKVKSGEIYGTYFLTGKDSLYCESILIKRKK